MALRSSTLPTSRAILEVQLSDSVSVLGLQALLGIANALYGTHEWLSFADNAPEGQPVPDLDFTPVVPQLHIRRLEIGTPNLVTFLGSPEGLTLVASVLTMLGGFATAGTLAYKNFAEARKAESDARRNAAAIAKDLAEASLIDVKTKVAHEELTEKLLTNADLMKKLVTAQELSTQGKISQRSFEDKLTVPHMVAHNWILAAAVVKPQSFSVKRDA